MNELHLFAGHGGGILGGMLLGHKCVCAVERNQYRRDVLLQRQRDGVLPWFPVWNDVRTFDARPWNGKCDILAAGVPCKGFSTAGKMLGLDHPESGLWREVHRIAGEAGPRYIFVENTPAIVILGLSTILSDLSGLGYDARWCVLGGSAANLDADGPRFWLLAKATGERWPRVLQGESRLDHATLIEPGPAGDANPPTLAERIRKHERRCGQPAILGELDGLANRVERLEAIGDGQVPRLVVLAWRTLCGDIDNRIANRHNRLICKRSTLTE